MLQQTPVKLLLLSIMLFLSLCSKVDYTNPLDMQGTNYAGNEKSGDHDSDGVANMYDPDSKSYIKDTIPPVITLIGNATIQIPKDDPQNLLFTYVTTEAGRAKYTVTDNNDASIQSKVTITNNVEIFTVGTYQITYTAIDADGNRFSINRTVVIFKPNTIDVTPPTIELFGDTLVYITVGDVYKDLGVLANDYVDGNYVDLTDQIVIDNKVDTKKAGIYTITFSVKDAAGNSTTATRSVVVQEGVGGDLQPPVITLLGKDTLYLTTGQTISDYAEPGFTATDNNDGDVKAKVTVSAPKLFQTSVYSIKYSVTDSAGNIGEKTRYVILSGSNIDVTKPNLTLKGDTAYTIAIGGIWVDPGYRAIDNTDGDISDSVTVDSTLLNRMVEGIYRINYSVTDNAGNTSFKHRLVTVSANAIDTIKPVIFIKGRNPDTVIVGSATVYADSGAKATDNKDGDISATITATGTVDMAKAGTYTITYTVNDMAGQTGTGIRTVLVKRDPAGGDLLAKYAVPLVAALPAVSKKYTKVAVDGSDIALTLISSFTLNWRNDPPFSTGLDGFQLDYTASPYNQSFVGMTQTFDKAEPSFTLSGCTVADLNGEYYITASATECVWVKTDGSFAVVFTP